jgi:cob(I)alamin adenosyltransferase
MKIYTRKGDDGTTGLLFGGRVTKDSAAPAAYGSVDEAQAAIGVARAAALASPDESPGELADILLGLERDLWVLMGELATDPSHHDRLVDGQNRATSAMVGALEDLIDEVSESFEPPTDFVVPGQSEVSARLDVARTVVRRAEREAIGAAVPGSQSLAYLNRLSDLLWTLARWQEGVSITTRSVRAGSSDPAPEGR